MPRAFVIGGTGQIGCAAAATLAADGWDVVLVSRSGWSGDTVQGVRSATADRADDAQLRAALGPEPMS